MKYTHIKIAMIRNAVKQRDIANELGVSEALVSRVIKGEATSRRVARSIAEKLGTTPENIWPDRYVGPPT